MAPTLTDIAGILDPPDTSDCTARIIVGTGNTETLESPSTKLKLVRKIEVKKVYKIAICVSVSPLSDGLETPT